MIVGWNLDDSTDRFGVLYTIWLLMPPVFLFQRIFYYQISREIRYCRILIHRISNLGLSLLVITRTTRKLHRPVTDANYELVSNEKIDLKGHFSEAYMQDILCKYIMRGQKI